LLLAVSLKDIPQPEIQIVPDERILCRRLCLLCLLLLLLLLLLSLLVFHVLALHRPHRLLLCLLLLLLLLVLLLLVLLLLLLIVLSRVPCSRGGWLLLMMLLLMMLLLMLLRLLLWLLLWKGILASSAASHTRPRVGQCGERVSPCRLRWLRGSSVRGWAEDGGVLLRLLLHRLLHGEHLILHEVHLLFHVLHLTGARLIDDGLGVPLTRRRALKALLAPTEVHSAALDADPVAGLPRRRVPQTAWRMGQPG
jgi:hypothetical protein